MNIIESSFVPYQQSLDMKELGFDEPCLFAYNQDDENKLMTAPQLSSYQINTGKNSDVGKINKVTAPLYQQAARYLYVNSNKQINFQIDGNDNYEELCEKLKKCIKDFRDLQNSKS
jgi:hypothetical protein